jgi:hypothetical protein
MPRSSRGRPRNKNKSPGTFSGRGHQNCYTTRTVFEPSCVLFKELKRTKKELISQCFCPPPPKKKSNKKTFLAGCTILAVFCFSRGSWNLTPREKRGTSGNGNKLKTHCCWETLAPPVSSTRFKNFSHISDLVSEVSSRFNNITKYNQKLKYSLHLSPDIFRRICRNFFGPCPWQLIATCRALCDQTEF